ncbi:hypothetical protein JOD45_001678 [Scopulibacillus daqui]|uniref:Uncharacterized protein n=2 Tax=Scopulibacillus daqui TaxID=1469162 RepID=A0ABS2PZK4_9BACL|nr:hypothetical protein [Scopulibacillus daqui]
MEENKKVFALLKEMEKRGMARNLFLLIEYKNNEQIYDIEFDSSKKNPYHKPEDLNKALMK